MLIWLVLVSGPIQLADEVPQVVAPHDDADEINCGIWSKGRDAMPSVVPALWPVPGGLRKTALRKKPMFRSMTSVGVQVRVYSTEGSQAFEHEQSQVVLKRAF